MVMGITSLQRLQSLTIDDEPTDELQATEPDVLRLLFSSVPASLQTLSLPRCRDLQRGFCHLEFRMRNGRVASLKAGATLNLCALIRFLASVLLPSGALGPELDSIDLVELRLAEDLLQLDWALLRGPEAQQLRQLLQRCPQVRVNVLEAGRGVSASVVLEALDLLGERGRPQHLRLEVRVLPGTCDHLSVELAQPPCRAAPPPRPAAGDPVRSESPGAPPAPLTHDLVRRALGRLLAAEAPHPGSAPAAADPGSPRLLLLRGTLVAGLAWSHHALTAWMLDLLDNARDQLLRASAAAAAAAGGGAGAGAAAAGAGAAGAPFAGEGPDEEEEAVEEEAGSDGAADAPQPLMGYWVLPHAGCMLMQCSSPAAAVEAAARAAVQTVEEAAVGDAAAALQVLRLPWVRPAAADEEYEVFLDSGPAAHAQTALVDAMSEEAQRIWRDAALNGGCNGWQKVEWLLGQWVLASERLWAVWLDGDDVDE